MNFKNQSRTQARAMILTEIYFLSSFTFQAALFMSRNGENRFTSVMWILFLPTQATMFRSESEVKFISLFQNNDLAKHFWRTHLIIYLRYYDMLQMWGKTNEEIILWSREGEQIKMQFRTLTLIRRNHLNTFVKLFFFVAFSTEKNMCKTTKKIRLKLGR